MKIQNKAMMLPIGDQDKYYFHEGKHIYAYNFMGAYKTHQNGVDVISIYHLGS